MNKQINSLTATRAFAAIMVFIFHTGTHVYPFNKLVSIFTRGNIAVSYFYVLSGFVLYISYVNNSTEYWCYLRKRLGRIAPVYMLALAFSIYKRPFSTELIWQTIYSFFFIQAFIPKYAVVLNTAGWSISVEMFFYVLFPFILAFQKERNKLFVMIAIFIFIVTQIVFFKCFKNDSHFINNRNFFIYSPIIHLNEFLIGMVGGYAYGKANHMERRYSFVPFLLLSIILISLALKPDGLLYDAGLFAPLFMLFILATAIADPIFVNLRANASCWEGME